MRRYDWNINYAECDCTMVLVDDGRYVKYDDAMSEIEKLRAESLTASVEIVAEVMGENFLKDASRRYCGRAIETCMPAQHS